MLIKSKILIVNIFYIYGKIDMKQIGQKSVSMAFSSGTAQNVTIRKISDGKWYFTFEADDPITGQVGVFAVETQRGARRAWSDPRSLFNFLERMGVSSGNFNLTEEPP